MASIFEAILVNDPFGDAGLYLDFRFARRALLFDIGDIGALPPRKLLRLSHVFVSHAHMDHFSGFDRLLALCLNRPQRLQFHGPPGFADRVAHKLCAYSWNLIAANEVDFVIGVAEFDGDRLTRAAEFHTKDAFQRRDVAAPELPCGVLLDEEEFCVKATALDHGIPSLAFALEEKLRLNVWRDQLEALGLSVGPWLNDLKAAVRRGAPDETLFAIPAANTREGQERRMPLGDLKGAILRLGAGEKLAYVVDAVYHDENARRIIALARGADRLFIETVFLDADKALAARRLHLTAAQAGSLAREAGVKRLIPFHFSPRYQGREAELRAEAEAAFTGAAVNTDENALASDSD